jgi:hypothetical protein
VISTSLLFISIDGAILSLVSIGFTGPSGSSSPPPQAENKLAAVHSQIVLTAVEAIGAIAVIVFTLAGITLGVVVVAVGIMLLTPIQVFIKVSLTAFLVFSINFEALLC